MFESVMWLYHTVALGSMMFVYQHCRKKRITDWSKVTYKDDMLFYHEASAANFRRLKDRKKDK